MTRRLAILEILDDPSKTSEFVASHQFPIVESSAERPGEGSAEPGEGPAQRPGEAPVVTFVWFGQADEVSLRHWVFGLEASTALQRAPNSELWYLTLEIPAASRVEYKFEIRRAGASEWIEDPLNPNRARDPFGANSVLQTHGYEPPAWTKPDDTARQGTLVKLALHSAAFGSVRTIPVYLPARFRKSRQYPLLVVHDGSDYLNYASMKTVLDNLIHSLVIPDLVVAFTDSPDRLNEYASDERHARFLSEELLVALNENFPLLDKPQSRCLMGASFGAVAAFSTAWRYPGKWGRLLLQSGSFAFTDIGKHNRRGPVFDKVVEFVNAYRANPQPVSEKVFLSCGVYESLIYENRSLLPLLQSTGMEVRLIESRDGHNWENWRDRLRDGLSWLFPGPLLFIYE